METASLGYVAKLLTTLDQGTQLATWFSSTVNSPIEKLIPNDLRHLRMVMDRRKVFQVSQHSRSKRISVTQEKRTSSFGAIILDSIMASTMVHSAALLACTYRQRGRRTGVYWPSFCTPRPGQMISLARSFSVGYFLPCWHGEILSVESAVQKS